MDILNDTPFPCVALNGRLSFPGHSLTFIIKGAFELSAGGQAIAADEQPYPTGDEYYPDDEAMQAGPRYASDFAYFKPRADLLLVGTCHAPNGKPVARCPAVFQVGDRRAVLAVSGDRTWQRPEPEPFTRMPLRYENSFGGRGYDANPVGKGIDPRTGPDGRKLTPLPNVEHLGALLRSPDQRPAPAGFAPLNQTWTQRSSKLGSYGGDYVAERWPWFAADFDWGFFNAAPPELQVEGYLRGDEPVYFENLHPEHARLHAALPGLRVRCFVKRAETSAEARTFHEVPMRLDTLWVDMDQPKLVLVWRGPTKVESEEPTEIEHVYIVSESLSEPQRPVEDFRALFERRLAELEQEGAVEIEPDGGEDPDPAEAGDGAEEEIARAEEELRANLLAAGIDPDNLPPPDEEALAEEARILKELGFDEDPAEIPLTREDVEARVAAGESLANEDL
ncbi:MAG TPA: DUF2169 domain-containing protein, partial [Gammaproteobacteria bacterium]|nr:DUF2169 domain-containing protein [Gammaproteobacteria bacterium]